METNVNGIRVRYDDVGEGPVVLLLHAFPLSAAMWRPQLEALRGRYRVLAPDGRGFGGSDAPPGLYSMDQLADDAAALLDQLQIPEVILGGLSMGGYVAFAFLRRHRARVRALILADTRAGADSDEGRAKRESNARLAEEQGATPIAEQMLPALLALDAPADLHDELRALIVATNPTGIAGALRGMAARPDSSADLGEITIPTLVIVGAEDTLTPPAEAQRLQAGIAGSSLVTLPGAAHLPNLERPVEFNAALLGFLEKVGGDWG